jgi:threonine dehydrogenase-like Zn-dependent dehydrogenase
MKAAIFDGNDISIQTVHKPAITDSQVLIEVKSVGICGTDLAILNKSLHTPTPIILGHEFAGNVIEIGHDVNPEWLNKRVTSEINTNIDFNCHFCREGKITHCVSRKALGIDVDGALVEQIAVESYMLHEIPDSISYDDATFIEPLAAAYQVFEMMPLQENDKDIVIFGVGKLGLLITQVAVSKGLRVFVVDGSHKKLTLAKKLGAHYLINRFKDPKIPKLVKNATLGLGADIVVDATGNPLAVNDVIASCKSRGKVHLKSTHGQNSSINLTDIVIREITLYSSRCGPFDKAIEGLKSGTIQVEKLITKTFMLDDIKKAVSPSKDDQDHIKTIVHT